MPRTIAITPALAALIRRQHGVVHVAQLAMHELTPSAVQGHVRRREWRRILPEVVIIHGGEPTWRQWVVAVQLWAGEDAAIDGATACRYYGLSSSGLDTGRLQVVAPFGSGTRTRAEVKVRRSIAEIDTVSRGVVRFVLPRTAVVVAARNAPSGRDAVAILSAALQLGLVSLADLAVAREMLGDKWCRGVDEALAAVGVGIRSPAEDDAKKHIRASRVLPEPKWNQWLDLGDGGAEVCTDVLIEDAGMFHEVNGKRYHGWGERYESTHVRIERMTAAGLLPTQATAIRWRRHGPEVVANLERIYLQNAGRGMPSGVKLIGPPEWTTRRRTA